MDRPTLPDGWEWLPRGRPNRCARPKGRGHDLSVIGHWHPRRGWTTVAGLEGRPGAPWEGTNAADAAAEHAAAIEDHRSYLATPGGLAEIERGRQRMREDGSDPALAKARRDRDAMHAPPDPTLWDGFGGHHE